MVVHVVGILLYSTRCRFQIRRDDLELENEVLKIVNLENDSSLRWVNLDCVGDANMRYKPKLSGIEAQHARK